MSEAKTAFDDYWQQLAIDRPGHTHPKATALEAWEAALEHAEGIARNVSAPFLSPTADEIIQAIKREREG